MVRAIVLLLVLVFVPTMSEAQMSIASVTFSSGESPISSGLQVTVILEDKAGKFLDVTAQEQQAWVIFGKTVEKGRLKFQVAGSGGHFQGAPWFSPYLTARVRLSEKVSVGTMYWPAFFPINEPRDWEDGVNPEAIQAGHFGDIDLTIGNLRLSIAGLNFLDDAPNAIPGVGYTMGVRKGFSITASASRNINAKSMMYYIGATWSPQ